MANKKSTQIVRFTIVGFSNAVITYVIYVMMRKLLDFDEEFSNAVGYIAALVNNFVWSKLWVFQARKTNVWREVFFFLVAFAVAYGCQFVFFTTLRDTLQGNEYLAQFLGLFVYGAVNFMVNKYFTFKKNVSFRRLVR